MSGKRYSCDLFLCKGNIYENFKRFISNYSEIKIYFDFYDFILLIYYMGSH